MDKYAGIVQKLVSLSIKLIAVDFDLTILNVHTHGNWQFTAKSLASRVRPAFKQFLTAVLECDQLHVAVVTQSPQVSLVREVLEETLPRSNTGRIHIRGNDGTWRAIKGVSKEGKTSYSVLPSALLDQVLSIDLVIRRLVVVKFNFACNYLMYSIKLMSWTHNYD